MPKKKFHISPDGVKACEAYERTCPYIGENTHFDTKAEALAVEKKLRAYQKRMFDVHQIKQRLSRKAPEDVYQTYIGVDQPDALRTFADDVEENPYDPIGYRVHTNVEVDNGSFSPIQMTLQRVDTVHPQTYEIYGQWVLKTHIENDEENDFFSSDEELALHLKNDMEADQSYQKLHRAIKKNVYRSGLDPEDEEEEIDRQTNEHYANFINIINAVETEAAGSFTAWDRGTGYFRASDPEVVRADITYSQSAFRGRHVREFLAENPIYATATPTVDIRVSEYDETGAGWEINTADGHWWIKLEDSDGYTVEEDILDEDETYHRVYLASRDTLGRHDSETERHAEFAAEMVKEVNAALRQHPERINAYWEQEKQIREQRDQHFVNGVLNKPDEDRDSAIDKIFNLFKK